MLSVLRNRNFALLWCGQLISAIGDWVLIVALPFYILNLTGSILATGTMFIVEALPRLFLGSLAGVFVDCWDRRKTMITVNIARSLILLLLLLIHSRNLLWVIYVVAFVQSSLSQFFSPAMNSIIPTLVREQDLVAANSLDSVADSTTRLVGSSCGGIIFGFLGISGVVSIDSISFLICAVMLVLVSVPARPAERIADPVPSTSKSVVHSMIKIWHDWLNGLQLVRKTRLFIVIFITSAIVMLSQGIINSLFPVFVKEVMHKDAIVFGWLITLQGIGSLSGSFLIGWIKRFWQPAYLIFLGMGVPGVIFLIFINVPSEFIVLPLTFISGMLFVCFFVGTLTLLQSNVEDRYRGRIFGTYATTNGLLTLIGLALGSLFSSSLGIVFMLDIAGVLLLVAGLFGFTALQNLSDFVSHPLSVENEEP